MASTGAIVLAAGQGKRMGSPIPKVLQPINGRPMIAYVMDVLGELGFGTGQPKPVVVVGVGAKEVECVVGDAAKFVLQGSQLGTGDAAAVGVRAMPAQIERVLLIHGDEPLIAAYTYRSMIDLQRATKAVIVLLTGEVSDTKSLGRVIRDDHGQIQSLVQEEELTREQRLTAEINFGAYVFDRAFLENGLPLLEKHASGEYYLTDLVRFAVNAGRQVLAVAVPDPDGQMGINDAEQLARAEAYLNKQVSVTGIPSRTQ